MGARIGWLALVVASFASGCAQYPTVRMEFDSATGFDAAAQEPRELDYRDEVMRWPWALRQIEGTGVDGLFAFLFGAQPGPTRIDNPSEFVRERLQLMTELSEDDLGRIAETSLRVLWIAWAAAADPQPLNQMVAIDCMAALLEVLGVDPLDVPFPTGDPEAVERTAVWIAAVEQNSAGRRAGPLDEEARTAYLEVLGKLSERPTVRPSQDRQVIRVLLQAARQETDPTLRAAVVVSLRTALGNALGHQLRIKLRDPAADVREAALLALYRLSGPRVVPVSLFALAGARRGSATYDQSPDFRRTWVRLCAQLPREWVFESYQGGPTPIEFLYDTAKGDEDPGLQLVALDAMARCLAKPISFDPQWADEWWRLYALSRERGS
jgi:hypothetical protein